jgi:hypothetical protein
MFRRKPDFAGKGLIWLTHPDEGSKKFAFISQNFKPSNYKTIDLFEAVVVSEKMVPESPEVYFYTANFFASDVVFVSQSGTYIVFKTADNAIAREMKIATRSGLSAGQKVRVYYCLTKHPITEWEVRAIEKL